ncbi:hypothetical protein M9Y10_029788 [Tritrichomonas musculus]|uniref:Uncharacterized protein n=1 Tax=Tritrichomonas musculus TaxID=1915356 RepID=A0ABR2KN74_9EUKA
MLNLNIQLQSIYLSKEIVGEFDTIRVSITTVPDGQKQAQTFEVREMKKAQPTFKIQMNDQTEKVIIVFRKKNIFGTDHIIASTTLKSKDIHIFKELVNNEHMKISIYEPLQNNNSKNNNSKTIAKKNRRIVGTMEIDFSLHEEFHRQKMNENTFSRIDPIMYNQTRGNTDFLFQDPIAN